MYKTLLSYAPEQIFLMQGNLDMFSLLVEDASKCISTVEKSHISRFTMNDATAIVTFNRERASGSWCIVYFDVFMSDAAQVLLKTLEEPQEGIHIVFITPHPYLVPQTIRSRVRLIPGTLIVDTPEYLSSKTALHTYVKNTFSTDSEEDASVRRAQATVFLDALEHHVRTSPTKSQLVYEAKEMLFKANMPTKQVVEYVVSMVW